jgi:hypothetical protein
MEKTWAPPTLKRRWRFQLSHSFGCGWLSKITVRKMGAGHIKHCTMSGNLGDTNDVVVHVLDGINNKGFSGGPVLWNTGPNQSVFAVISGYHTEPLKVLPASIVGDARVSAVPPPPTLPGQNSAAESDQIVEANSGFILAYDIDPAIKAIRANPIGPLRPETPAPANPPKPAQ